MDMRFTKGQFVTLRAAKKVHLGSLARDIEEGDMVEYDGQTLRHSGEDLAVSNLRAAIRAGWFTSEDTSVTIDTDHEPEAPKHKTVTAIENDERFVSFATKEARDRATAPKTPVTKADIEANAAEGKAVGRVRVPSHQRTVVADASTANSEISRMENLSAPRKTVATGDVQEALSGDDLEDLLPEAVSSRKPSPGPDAEALARAEATRQSRLASVQVAEEPAATDVAVSASEARMAVVKLALPDFEWDLNAHWRSRVKTALSHKDNPLWLNAIMAVEIDSVKKHIAEALKA
jgi:hypothetical protein